MKNKETFCLSHESRESFYGSGSYDRQQDSTIDFCGDTDKKDDNWFELQINSCKA